jgi:hypothetical protein
MYRFEISDNKKENDIILIYEKEKVK